MYSYEAGSLPGYKSVEMADDVRIVEQRWYVKKFKQILQVKLHDHSGTGLYTLVLHPLGHVVDP